MASASVKGGNSEATEKFIKHMEEYKNPDIDLYRYMTKLQIYNGDTKKDTTDEIIMVSPYLNPMMPKFKFLKKEQGLNIYTYPN